MFQVIARSIDGALHLVGRYTAREAALEYLRRAAEECRASNHRRVELDENEGVLITSYGGDDTVVTCVLDEAKLA